MHNVGANIVRPRAIADRPYHARRWRVSVKVAGAALRKTGAWRSGRGKGGASRTKKATQRVASF